MVLYELKASLDTSLSSGPSKKEYMTRRWKVDMV